MYINPLDLQEALDMLPVLQKHPAFPIPVKLRPTMVVIVEAMDGLPEDTVVVEWIRKQLKGRGV